MQKCQIDSVRCFDSCELSCHRAWVVRGGAWCWVGGKPRQFEGDYQQLTLSWMSNES